MPYLLSRRWLRTGLFALFFALLGGAAALWLTRSGPSEKRIQQAVVTTLQHEADTTVFITGYLELSAVVRLAHTRRFPAQADLPWYTRPFYQAAGAPQVSLGTNETRVQTPGRVSYGFDVSQLTADNVHVQKNQTVVVTLPELSIYSVEPYLQKAEIQTQVGWARPSASGDALEKNALGQLRTAMYWQGKQHLQDSEQPKINTARALKQLLSPALKTAGLTDPRFEFRFDHMVFKSPVG